MSVNGAAQELTLEQAALRVCLDCLPRHALTVGLGEKKQEVSHLLLLIIPWPRAGPGSCCESGDLTSCFGTVGHRSVRLGNERPGKVPP